MSRDFTLATLDRLYRAYLAAGFETVTFAEALGRRPASPAVILRHDVDKKPGNSLRVAQMQHALGIRGTYYFRVVPESCDFDILKQIAALGHEIGYHYEDLTLCHGDLEKAAEHFDRTLALFRRYYPVTTICMHGSPMSRWDTRDLWKVRRYQDFGLTGEPYFDLDLSDGLYLTDTGRSWSGDAFSIRDRIPCGHALRFTTTSEIIAALQQGRMPRLIMQTFHPQRWSDRLPEWALELTSQRVKNVAKVVLRRWRMRHS
jgi:hypothetical protein